MAERTVHEAAERFKAADTTGTFQGWLPHQLEAFKKWETLEKACVYYPTGKGKTQIMLTMVWLRGYSTVVVIAPPITHSAWIRHGRVLGLKVIAMGHAKFRQKDVKLQRETPVIVDEVHLCGGQTGAGWTKLDKMAAHLKAPVVLGSATPNYNDVERVYCVAHVIDPHGNRGGFIGWLYRNCETEENPFGSIPNVVRPLHYKDAEEMLAALPGVIYIPDEAPDILQDVKVGYDPLPDEFDELGVDRSRDRIIASMMEESQRESLLKILTPDETRLTDWVAEALGQLDGDTIFGQLPDTVLIFAQRSTVAKVIYEAYRNGMGDYPGDVEMQWYFSCGYIDGSMTTKQKLEVSEAWVRGEFRVLIGTASLATGADGMDKMCNHLIIVDDTNDDSLRRQLVGRILPRGNVKPEDYAGKVAYRFVYSNN